MVIGQVGGLQSDDPRRVGPYRILGRLGAGGMGTVYLAESSGEQVAVKVIHSSHAADPVYRKRFTQEITAARAVRSEYTAKVVDSQAVGDPLYVATEVVQGQPLDRMAVPGRGLPSERVVSLARDIARALRDIHREGLVHRDVKPSNVVVGAVRAVLIDFGIATTVADIGRLTSTGKVMGTLPYQAPELVSGGAPASEQSDIFAWGCVVYYAATGQGPFGDGAAGEVIPAILGIEPDLRAVPGEVRELVGRALSKKARERPTAEEVVAELESEAASVVVCGAPQAAYPARLRKHLMENGFIVRISTVPETLDSACVLLILETDRPSPEAVDMRLAAERRNVPVRRIVVTGHRRPDAFLDARTNALPGPAHLTQLRALARAEPRPQDATGPVDRTVVLVAGIRTVLRDGDLIAADRMTTDALLAAAGRSSEGWMTRSHVARIGTAFLTEIADVWQEETDGRHGFRAQRALLPDNARNRMGPLSQAFGWKYQGHIPDDYEKWVAERVDVPGFFPTLRPPQQSSGWYDNWSITITAVHDRISEERRSG
ncbi:protein kinase domain-containing protein [Actinokineospora sp. UTMC 2448]|uniref:protein kinase domain-containing protein n=1 Tax=Actinokineospora sp. UTMC 2448 TaxID=2268449 RepID=UPI0021646CF6|nr:protein kinase [Actinokineospora sp. UTMC 2448]UVS80570.1 Serine/threonine-protein kinase AfsK [Actinokineospora sp. UTMC 2448]